MTSSKATPAFSMPICYARVIAHGLELAPSELARLLLGSGLSAQDLDDSNAYVSFEQQRAIVCNALQISGDPGIGLRLGALTPLSTHGALGLAAVSSRDLGAALDMLVRYCGTRAGFLGVEARSHDGVMLLDLIELTDLGPVRHFMHEVLMLTLQALLHAAIGPRLPGVALRFGYAAPAHHTAYADAFQLPLQFDAGMTGIDIPLPLMARRCMAADHKAARLAERQCMRELEAMQEHRSLAAQVQQALIQRLADGAAMDEVARSLRLSARTLVRRLAQEGTSYRQVLEQARRAQAESYLRDSAHTIAEIAGLLGYSDPSNLGRAFRGWCGMSPSAYRERHRSRH